MGRLRTTLTLILFTTAVTACVPVPTTPDRGADWLSHLGPSETVEWPEGSAVLAPPTAPLHLTAEPFEVGQEATLTVDGLPTGSQDRVVFLLAPRGALAPGARPPCHPSGTPCLGIAPPPKVLGGVRSDGSGSARLTVDVPVTAPEGQTIALQAATIAAQGASADAVSNVVEITIQAATDACAGVDCSPGLCEDSTGLAQCLCPPGYLSTGSTCDPVDTGPACADADGDGYGTGPACTGPDCDDADEDVFPDAPELCDGVDNQCAGDVGFGDIDEGCALCGPLAGAQAPPEQPGVLSGSYTLAECNVRESLTPDFTVVNGWFAAVYDGTGEPATLEIEQFRVIAMIGGVPTALEPVGSMAAPAHGVLGAGLYDRDPWFGTDDHDDLFSTDPGVFTIDAAPHGDVVMHGWTGRVFLPPPGTYTAIWAEARVRTSGPVKIQLGLDGWETMDSFIGEDPSEDILTDAHLELAMGDWHAPACDGDWFTLASARNPLPTDVCEVAWIDETSGPCGCDDVDGDGRGVPTCADLQCSGGDDCDDADPYVLPGGEEFCATPLDDDCDGMVGEPDCVATPIEARITVHDTAGNPNKICVHDLSDDHFYAMDRIGDAHQGLLPLEPGAPKAFVLVEVEADANCWADTSEGYLEDVHPRSDRITVEGLLRGAAVSSFPLQTCVPRPGRPTGTDWVAHRVVGSPDGTVIDDGAERCDLGIAAPGDGEVAIVADVSSVDPGHSLCLRIVQPGDAWAEMQEVSPGRYAADLSLSPPATVDLALVEWTGPCSTGGFHEDVHPGRMGTSITANGSALTECIRRHDSPPGQTWIGVRIDVDGSAGVSDAGDLSCPPVTP